MPAKRFSAQHCWRSHPFASHSSNYFGSPGAVLSVNAINEMINLGGTLGTRYALLLAPLSLVQAIGSTTTLFVFAFGIVLSIFFPTLGHEELSRWELVRKGVAAVVVAIGAILVSH